MISESELIVSYLKGFTEELMLEYAVYLVFVFQRFFSSIFFSVNKSSHKRDLFFSSVFPTSLLIIFNYHKKLYYCLQVLGK